LKGNPHGITTLADLLTKELRLAQGNPESTGIGVVTQRTLSALGQWDALKAKTTVFKTTVNEVANDVKLQAVDAGIVYDVVLHDYETLEAVTLPELRDARSRVAVCVLTTSAQPQAAQHFVRYLGASDRGLKRYAEFGFQPVAGEPWSDPSQAAQP
jgi:molybdate transport system substrate-binding protein